ncbi:DeoR family transcriptional regulator [Deinococcus sp. HMF7620]|uniref:DeoR family transcriptional regulator n=1 Tax=Deinococcus arboris TaxID=2682977 RepID=A0A7C9M827_9DEIO|nr:DeoR/GlpR family DNA-binding transcription regulator [Deinococcus arboris]MVN86643.1 DeoR family transcriptional regulator [Deinococcus arboris]
MFAEERQRRILTQLRLDGRVAVLTLAAQYGVSEHTIRRDLNSLAGRGHLHKTHGGAVALDTAHLDWNGRVQSLPAAKEAIGAAAATLVQPGATVILDASSTTVALARHLRVRPLTVITNSLEIAAVFGADPGVSLIVTGGVWNASARALRGAAAQEMVRHSRADWAFLGACGLEVRAGVTVTDADDAALKRAMAQSATQVAVLADHSKRGQVVAHWVLGVEALTVLVTDQPWPALTALGVDVRTEPMTPAPSE